MYSPCNEPQQSLVTLVSVLSPFLHLQASTDKTETARSAKKVVIFILEIFKDKNVLMKQRLDSFEVVV